MMSEKTDKQSITSQIIRVHYAETLPANGEAGNAEGFQHPLNGNRSFTLRRGRMTAGQQAAYTRLLPKYRVPENVLKEGPVDFEALFGRHAPIVVEIGSGMGEATAEIAKNYPDIDFIAVEVFPPGIGNLLKLIEETGLTNLKVAPIDAAVWFAGSMPVESLDGVHVFFPDPWRKARHHKRRLIQPPFIKLVVNALKPDGYLHCATDWENYAEQMEEFLDAEPTLAKLSDEAVKAASKRCATKFETRGKLKGHSIKDLIYKKQTL